MKIGIGIDTGGTCTDAVVYQFEEKRILAKGKTPTTKEDLSVGIGNALDQLPKDMIDKAEVIALSTTLATNACVENKGGRAKIIFFGVNPGNVSKVGKEYGITVDENVLFVESKTRPNGEITEHPDWDAFEQHLKTWLIDCDAVAVVEMYAKKTGAVLEQKTRKLIQRKKDIPVVCGYSLFSETNIIKRGAGALLNARLISVIREFLDAVKKALKERNIQAPFVIVRSDGSLMTEEFTSQYPVETLLCGPVASVMGAVELTDEKNCVVVDIGGTTTDIAFVKEGTPKHAENGVRIGEWNTFVKGLFVDTFGLGGDSGVIINGDLEIELEAQKVMPLCMAAGKYPTLLRHLERERDSGSRLINRQKDIYVKIKDIENISSYSAQDLAIVSFLETPHSLERIKELHGQTILARHLERLIREGIIIRCGITPTDVMHVRGDFVQYEKRASFYGMEIMARALRISVEELGDRIYDIFKKKLFINIVRILIEDAYPKIRERGIGETLTYVIEDAFERAKKGEAREFLGLDFSAPAALVGVGAPTKLFLEEVGNLLHTKVVTSAYSPVANALGAIVGNVSAESAMEVIYHMESNSYTVFGCGHRSMSDDLSEAKEKAKELAAKQAVKEAISRGANVNTLAVTFAEKENIIQTEFGSLYMGYKVIATAAGNLDLNKK